MRSDNPLVVALVVAGLACVATPLLAQDVALEPAATAPAPERARDFVDEEKVRELPPAALGLSELIGPLAKTMLMLCVVLALVYLTLHKGLGKLIERQNVGKRVKVVERVALDPKRSLFLVEIDGKQMLLAAGEGGVVHLTDVEPRASASAAPAAGGKGLGVRFAEALKNKVADRPPVSVGLPRGAVITSDDPPRGA